MRNGYTTRIYPHDMGICKHMVQVGGDPTEWAVVAAAVLSMVAGLQVGEMVGIKV